MIRASSGSRKLDSSALGLRIERDKYRKALERITKLYVKAPGWASPTPTTQLVYGMYDVAKKALDN